MIPTKNIVAAILLCCSHFLLYAQKGEYVLPPADLNELAKADAKMENQRFAAPIALNLGTETGEWISNNGVNGVWQLQFKMPNSLGLAIYLDQINLAAGAEITLENETGKRGPFTSKDVSSEGRLFTGFLPGSEVTLIYRGTVFNTDHQPFHIWRADHAYRSDIFDPQKSSSLLNFGGSNECQINANCSQGTGFESERSAVARIIAVAMEGSFYCSGSLMNNTARDGRPLLLTAYHCQENVTALYDLWRFDFGYRSSGCENPTSEPAYTSYNGSLFRAGRQESDFLLLEIVDPDFDQSNHYFNGWDRTDAGFTGVAVGFHHPMGDIQKVTNSTLSGLSIFGNSISWENIETPPNHHLRMVIDQGSAENGSSGSPIFDTDHRIRGQLHGGSINCPGSSIIYYGRIFQSWTGGGTANSRLSDWLDPLGQSPDVLDGQNLTGNGLGRIVRGTARWVDSTRLADVQLIFNWGNNQIDTVRTDTAGYYQLTRPANATAVNIATNFEQGDSLTGVNVIDIIALRRHILALDTLSDRQLVAADVTNNGNESVGDIVKISRVILGYDSWELRPNWLVYPKLLSLAGLPINVFGPFDISIPNPDAGIITLDFEVCKNGDVNESAY